jgi:hypothetical protein
MARMTKSPVLDSLLQAISEVPDPRVERTKLHPLVNVLTMALLGAICGADGWEALELFAKERAKFFRTFLAMRKGTPSADTFRRAFEALAPSAFQDAFRRWLEPFLDNLKGQTNALDGQDAARGLGARGGARWASVARCARPGRTPCSRSKATAARSSGTCRSSSPRPKPAAFAG